MDYDIQLDVWSQIETIQPTRKVIITGASNVSRAFSIVISSLLHAIDEPISIHIAKGHGRSYGIETSFLGKKNSGIFYCRIFDEWTRENSVPINACLTDIGNDLAYEQPVEKIIGWVETSIDRLLSWNARVVLTALPINALRQLHETRYKVLKTLLFPYCRLSLKEILNRAELLNRRLIELAETRNIPVFIVPDAMYGRDPIHPRGGCLQAIWKELIGLMLDQNVDWNFYKKSHYLSWYLARLRSETGKFFSKPVQSVQPSGILTNGTKIFLY